MLVIYMIYAANWVDLIEVPLGANVIPRGDGIGIICEYSYVFCTRSPSEERF